MSSYASMQIGRDQLSELAAGLVLFELAPEGGGSRHRILLLDAAHHHAKMRGFDDHGHPKRVKCFLDRMEDLGGQPFLHLKTAGVDVHYAGDLAEPGDPSIGDIGYVRLTKKRQHV